MFASCSHRSAALVPTSITAAPLVHLVTFCWRSNRVTSQLSATTRFATASNQHKSATKSLTSRQSTNVAPTPSARIVRESTHSENACPQLLDSVTQISEQATTPHASEHAWSSGKNHSESNSPARSRSKHSSRHAHLQTKQESKSTPAPQATNPHPLQQYTLPHIDIISAPLHPPPHPTSSSSSPHRPTLYPPPTTNAPRPRQPHHNTSTSSPPANKSTATQPPTGPSNHPRRAPAPTRANLVHIGLHPHAAASAFTARLLRRGHFSAYLNGRPPYVRTLLLALCTCQSILARRGALLLFQPGLRLNRGLHTAPTQPNFAAHVGIAPQALLGREPLRYNLYCNGSQDPTSLADAVVRLVTKREQAVVNAMGGPAMTVALRAVMLARRKLRPTCRDLVVFPYFVRQDGRFQVALLCKACAVGKPRDLLRKRRQPERMGSGTVGGT